MRIFRGTSRISVPALAGLLALSACGDSDSDSTDAAVVADGGGAPDAVTMTDSAGMGDTASKSDGGGSVDAGSVNDSGVTGDAAPPKSCAAATVALPTTTATIDGVPYYMVLKSQLPVQGAYVVQLNFGTEAQFHECPKEPGQNSTWTLGITFKAKPTATGVFKYTSSRSLDAADQVNFYLNFLNKTGHVRMNKGFKTPDTGMLNVTIAAAKLSATLTNVLMTNESKPDDTFALSGTLNLDW
jgi:hypothetical protein